MKKESSSARSGRFKWIRAWKTAFASARTRSGPHMVACTAKPISIGLQPSGKSWRHQRPRSPVNRPRKRSDARLHVRRLPERSRWRGDRMSNCDLVAARSPTAMTVGPNKVVDHAKREHLRKPSLLMRAHVSLFAAPPRKVSAAKMLRKPKEFAQHFKRHFLKRHLRDRVLPPQARSRSLGIAVSRKDPLL